MCSKSITVMKWICQANNSSAPAHTSATMPSHRWQQQQMCVHFYPGMNGGYSGLLGLWEWSESEFLQMTDLKISFCSPSVRRWEFLEMTIFLIFFTAAQNKSGKSPILTTGRLTSPWWHLHDKLPETFPLICVTSPSAIHWAVKHWVEITLIFLSDTYYSHIRVPCCYCLRCPVASSFLCYHLLQKA